MEYKERFRIYISKRKARRKHWLSFYKKRKGCFVCGYNQHSCALDFHHSNPLEKEIRISDNLSLRLSKLINEIRKCSVVCSNCHRVLHQQEKGNL